MRYPNIKTAKKIEPKCYAYTTPEIARHNGWTKIGYTEQDNVEARIKQQTQTADIKFKLEWQDLAIYQDGSGDSFKDKDFHAYLQKKDVEKLSDSEWFHILPQDSYDEFCYFKQHRGILETLGVIPYKLRKEQNKAIEQTSLYFKSRQDDEPEFLWNAKPRFGKTLSAYALCKSLNVPKVLIVTNRPAIANSWYEDYVKFLGTESGYYFVSQVDGLIGKPYVLSREQYTKHISQPDHKGCIEFVSLQDMKGSIYFGGQYDKLKEVAELDWDILIIDEAHEGVDTYKTDVAFDHIKRKYTLHLSGTPFKALANSKFEEKAIFNWTYADEQKAKREWDYSQDEENPYENLPQLNLYTYQMSEIIRDKLQKGADFDNDGETEEYAFDLNEFFITNANGSFKYEADVDKFLDALVSQEKFPFSTPELQNELKHTFWLLNRVDSAKALAKKLQKHDVFKDYEIVLVFNDSVKEFLNLKRKLGNYFDEASKEDIFDYIPPQKTNQIYTPKKVVVEMVDSLLAENPECFDDPNKTFIDLYMKSGLYITEIVKRLYRNEKMKQAFPNDKERLQHIFANQVYGLAPTEIIYRIAIAYILGFSDEIKIEKHNLRQFDTLPAVQAGNLEQKLDEIYAHN